MTNFCLFYGEWVIYKVLRRFNQFSRSYEVKKFWIWRQWRHTAIVKTFHLAFSLHIFCLFYGKRTLNKVLWCSWPFFMNLRKFQNSESTNCVSTLVASSTRMNIHDVLIVAFIETSGISCWCYCVSWRKRIILSKMCYFGLSSPLKFQGSNFWN